jgi:hypothetical protein
MRETTRHRSHATFNDGARHAATACGMALGEAVLVAQGAVHDLPMHHIRWLDSNPLRR